MWLLLAILVAPVVWAIFTYNRLVALKNQVANGWKQIDVQLKRRHDLIPNLVSAVRGYMEYERDTLERVINARNQAAGATSVQQSNAAEADLTRALRQLFAVAENYPQLRANENVMQLQEQLTTTENQLGFARQYYNDVVMRFNTQQDVFPANLIASHFGFQHAELFAADESDRAVPPVDLSLKSAR
ncbi:MAG TPA: LemA family protein [Candidatus Dormibacteraeota bacterium]|nr:LemA family protein [Candidatus Dormibacteraeota bacterium]